MKDVNVDKMKALRAKMANMIKDIDLIIKDESILPTGDKTTLRPNDIRYIGSAKLPRLACGKSTGYCAGLLAVMSGPTGLRFFSDTHRETGGHIYEFETPHLVDAPIQDLGIVKVKKEWNDIYDGEKVDHKGNPIKGELGHTVNGLRGVSNNALMWTYGANYDTSGVINPSVGLSLIEVEHISPVSHPLTIPISNLWTRGGTVGLPKWFKDKVSGQSTVLRMGVGFGGYYSIVDGGSAGPCLTILTETSPKVKYKTVLGYPWNGEGDYSKHAPRYPDFNCTDGAWVGKTGDKWTAADEIGGGNYAAGATWIDKPNKHGLIYFTSQGSGKISYENGEIKAESRKNRVYIYNPNDLVKVANDEMKMWEPVPFIANWLVPTIAPYARVAGVHFEPSTSILYVVTVEAYRVGQEFYPIISGYKIDD